MMTRKREPKEKAEQSNKQGEWSVMDKEKAKQSKVQGMKKRASNEDDMQLP